MNFLTKSSQDNYKTIINVEKENSDLINNLVNMIELDELFESKKMKDVFNKFQKLYNQNDDKYIIKTEIIPFNDIKNNLMKYFDKISGLDRNINGTIVGKKFQELNTIKKIYLLFDNIDLHIELFFIYKEEKINLINQLIKRVCVYINYSKNTKRMKKIIKLLNNEPFEIYFLMYDVNRQVINRNNNNINELSNQGTYNCCSGYNHFVIYPNSKNKEMVITKIPEMAGLLTHEMGHLLGWDFGLLKNQNGKHYISLEYLNNEQENELLKLNIEKNQNFYFWETYENTQTTLIHSISNAIELDSSYDTFKQFYKYEILYSIYHAAKILYWHGFNDFNDFFRNGSKIKYYQIARLFEYSIVRSFFLLFYNKLFLQDINDDFTLKDQNKITEINNKIINLMVNNTPLIYEDIFNIFIEKVKSDKIINMEYFCIDLNLDNYYTKYVQYKKKYINQRIV